MSNVSRSFYNDYSSARTQYQQRLNNLRSQMETLTGMLAAVETPTTTDVARLGYLESEMQQMLDYASEKMGIC